MNRLLSLCMTILVSAALLLAIPCPAAAQGARQDVEQGRAMLRAGFRDVIREELLLTDAEGDAFWPVYDDYEAVVMGIMDRYAGLITRYVDRFNAGDLSNEYADELLDEYFAIRLELLEARRAHIPKFKAILPALKVAQLYQLENKLNAEVDIQLAMAIPLISE